MQAPKEHSSASLAHDVNEWLPRFSPCDIFTQKNISFSPPQWLHRFFRQLAAVAKSVSFFFKIRTQIRHEKDERIMLRKLDDLGRRTMIRNRFLKWRECLRFNLLDCNIITAFVYCTFTVSQFEKLIKLCSIKPPETADLEVIQFPFRLENFYNWKKSSITFIELSLYLYE